MKTKTESRGLYRHVTKIAESDQELLEVMKSIGNPEHYIAEAERVAGAILEDAGVCLDDDKACPVAIHEIDREALSVDAQQALDVLWYTHIAKMSLDSKDGRDGLVRGLWLAGAAERLNANLAFLKTVEARRTSNRNLQHSDSVTDEQLLEVVNDPAYPTRKAQADRLGISDRQIQNRLRKINREV